jgi:hypothetical protein
MWFSPMKLQSGQTYARLRMFITFYFPNTTPGTSSFSFTVDNWYVGPMTAPYTAFGLNAATP